MKYLILLTLLLTSCSIIDPDADIPDSTYPQLKGSFTYYNYTSWEGGLYEKSRYYSYDFDSTAVAWQYNCYWAYLPDTGWVNSTKTGSSFDIEWKVSGNTFSERLYDNDYSDWESFSFEHIDNDTIIINGLTYTRD